jgi:hypothetical protein
MNESPRGARHRACGRLGILLDSYAQLMRGYEPAIAA